MMNNKGFTLLEVVVVLGILAVLAGAVAPYAVKQIDAARLDATEKEMESIQQAILTYYKDCGRLPSEQSGLLALVQNADAAPGWRGPYAQGKGALAATIRADAWGSSYAYAHRPSVQQVGASIGFLLISPGADRVLQSGQVQAAWEVDTNLDIVLFGTTSGVDGSWREKTGAHLEDLADGLLRYFLDVGTFPAGQDSAALVALLSSASAGWTGPYVRGTPSGIVRDEWGNLILLRPCASVNSEAVAGWILLSDGPGPPSASMKNNHWLTGANDIHRVLPAGSLGVYLNRQRFTETGKRLKLLAGETYASNLAGSPETSTLGEKDPWGNAYKYNKLSAYSGILYSIGPDGKDETGSGDDIYEALSWSP